MEHLVKAAVEAAARAGAEASVIIIGGGGGGDTAASETNGSHAELVVAKQRVGELMAERADILKQLQMLQSVTPEGDGGAALQAAQARVAELEAKLTEQPMQQDALARIAELEQALAAAQAEKQSVGPGDTEKQGGDAGDTMLAAFINEPLKVLGAEDKVEKGLDKAGCKTIGDVRTRYLGDAEALKKDARLNKDDMISIGILLAGKAPSMSHAPAAPATPPAAPAVSDAPVDDRPWEARLDAARSKEARLETTNQKLAELRAKATKEHPDAVDPDGKVNVDKLLAANPTLANELRNEENTYNVVRGQLIAMLWSCNLPVNEPTIDAALAAKGVAAQPA